MVLPLGAPFVAFNTTTKDKTMCIFENDEQDALIRAAKALEEAARRTEGQLRREVMERLRRETAKLNARFGKRMR